MGVAFSALGFLGSPVGGTLIDRFGPRPVMLPGDHRDAHPAGAGEAHQKVYGFQFMPLNAGLGVGGVISALLIRVDDAATFERLYFLDALSYVYIAVVLRDRTLLRVVAISIVVVTFGYAQFEAGFAAYAVDVADVPPKALGRAFGAKTAAIVLGRLVTLQLIKGRRPTSMLAVCATVWSVSWAYRGRRAAVPAPAPALTPPQDGLPAPQLELAA